MNKALMSIFLVFLIGCEVENNNIDISKSYLNIDYNYSTKTKFRDDFNVWIHSDGNITKTKFRDDFNVWIHSDGSVTKTKFRDDFNIWVHSSLTALKSFSHILPTVLFANFAKLDTNLISPQL